MYPLHHCLIERSCSYDYLEGFVSPFFKAKLLAKYPWLCYLSIDLESHTCSQTSIKPASMFSLFSRHHLLFIVTVTTGKCALSDFGWIQYDIYFINSTILLKIFGIAITQQLNFKLQTRRQLWRVTVRRCDWMHIWSAAMNFWVKLSCRVSIVILYGLCDFRCSW